MQWKGVVPAITTQFTLDLQVDHAAVAEHCRRMIAAGCTGVVALGSLGEGATLERNEKEAILRTCVKALDGRAPVAAGISALSTRDAVDLAKMAQTCGCSGLMVLPPYVYKSDWREMKAHVVAILKATTLPAMLYNNPVAYGTDFLPEQIQELAAEHPNLKAVKESSTDARRVTAIRVLNGDRLDVLAGVDDMVVEGAAMGAVGWIAGVTNALPMETVALFKAAREGRLAEALALYSWMLPLLRMDTVPKFVQLIKLMQQEAGLGHERTRPPRLELAGTEREEALRVIHAALAHRKSASAH